jgi:hypothetical protein
VTHSQDADLQAYLDRDPGYDRGAADRWSEVTGHNANDDTLAALAAYRHVYAALAESPYEFRPGFADRVAARLTSRAEPARVQQPWAEWALFACVVMLGVATIVTFRETVAASWLGVSAPWLAMAAAVFALAEAADRLFLRDRHVHLEA